MDRPVQAPKIWIVKPCTLADQDHARYRRVYAHTFHRPGLICVARAFYPLPTEHAWAILAHEAGHLIAGEDGTEEDADDMAEDFFQIAIRYQDSLYHGKMLQTISLKDAQTISQQTFVIYQPNARARVSR